MADEPMTTAVEPAAPPALEPESKTQGDVPMEDADKETKTIEEPEGTNTFSVSLLPGHSSFFGPIAEVLKQSSTVSL